MALGVLDGYNGTVFAYGQTGSGKTYLMDGEVVPCAFKELFDAEARRGPDTSFLFTLQLYEIYNEKINDLLFGYVPESGVAVGTGAKDGGGTKQALQAQQIQQPPPPQPELQRQPSVREDKRHGCFVDGLNEVEVRSLTEVVRLQSHAKAKRAIAVTKMNKRSSRSHVLISLRLQRIELPQPMEVVEPVQASPEPMDATLNIFHDTNAPGSPPSSGRSSPPDGPEDSLNIFHDDNLPHSSLALSSPSRASPAQALVPLAAAVAVSEALVTSASLHLVDLAGSGSFLEPLVSVHALPRMCPRVLVSLLSSSASRKHRQVGCGEAAAGGGEEHQ